MQAQLKKKDSAPRIKCPRCHADNLASATKCIKCSFVFPQSSHAKDSMPHIPGTIGQAGSPGGAFGEMQGEGGNGGEEGEEEISEEVLLPKRPKHIPESGKREGIISALEENKKCPRCGADVKSYSKRCLKCGQKV